VSTRRVIVAGSHGFIGRYVTRALAADGWAVTGLHKNGYADQPKRPDHDGLASIVCDLATTLPRPIGCDAIVNLAAESHVDKSIADPVPFIQNNLMCALRMLELARLVGPKMFIQVSTDEVFGPAPPGVFYQEWDRQIPSSPYAASKSMQEMAAISYWRTYRVPVVIVRLMNNFGVGQNDEKMVPKTVRCIKEGKPVPVHAEQALLADGTEVGWVPGSRTWLHASNTADAIRFILANVRPIMYPGNHPISDALSDSDRPLAFNVSGDIEIDNADLVRRAGVILGLPAHIKYVDFHSSRPGHDRRYALGGEALRQRGWVPPTSFEDSFRETVLEMAK
jgi:dTDP-glucose 4,6-dehydratase